MRAEHDVAPGVGPGATRDQQGSGSTAIVGQTYDKPDYLRGLYSDLLAHGVPLILCRPNPRWTQDGKASDLIPLTSGWAKAEAEPSIIDQYRPGLHTVALVSGHGLDGIDVDPKNGADVAEVVTRCNSEGVRIVGTHITPSGGAHLLVASTGIATRNKPPMGVDFRGGLPDGESRGLLYLPGSSRPKYPDTAYHVLVPIDWQALAEVDIDAQREAITRVLSHYGMMPKQLFGTEKLTEFVAPEAMSTKVDIPAFLEAKIAEPVAVGNRSERFFHLVGECWRAGLTEAQTLGALTPWCKATGKYVGREARQVADCWPKVKDDLQGYLDGIATPAAPAEPASPEALAHDQAEEVPPNSWLSTDLSPILDGTYVPEVPDIMVRSDGLGLLYRGRVHSIHAESESGKSLFVQAEAAIRLNAGERVAYLDFESDAASVVRRILDLGADPEAVRQRFDYRRPEVAPGAGTPEGAEWLQLLAGAYSLIVLDGVTEAMDVLAPRGSGVDVNERIAGWLKRYPKRLAESTGAAVVLIDHVVKNAETRGRHAIGGQHKMNGLTGAAYTIDVKDQPRRGHVGVLHVNIAKDRPGGIRPHCGPMLADRTQLAAVVRIDGTGDRITVTLQAPTGLESTTSTFRPTVLMERVSRWLQDHPGEHSRTQIGREVQGKTAALFTGLDVLASEGFVKVSERQRGSITDRYYSHVSLFVEADDAPTIPTIPAPFPDHSRNGPTPEPVCTVPTVPTPSKGNGGKERSGVDPRNTAETIATIPAEAVRCSRCRTTLDVSRVIGLCGNCQRDDWRKQNHLHEEQETA